VQVEDTGRGVESRCQDNRGNNEASSVVSVALGDLQFAKYLNNKAQLGFAMQGFS